MEINKILDIYNKWLKDNYNTNTHLVLKKEVICSTITKSLKTFKYSLWYVNHNNVKQLCYYNDTVVGITEAKKKTTKDKLEGMIIGALFDLHNKEDFNNICKL